MMLNAAANKSMSKKTRGSIGKPHPKSLFTTEEDMKLVSIIKVVGDNNWGVVSQMMGNRNPRQCMERWFKYLSPDINKSPFTLEEDRLLIAKHEELGCKWMKISRFFNNRTDIALKNRWSLLQRREKQIEASVQSSPKCYTPAYFEVVPPQKTVEESKQQEILQCDQKNFDTFDFDFEFCDCFSEIDSQFLF